MQSQEFSQHIEHTCGLTAGGTHFATMPKLALDPITLLIQWILQAPSAGVKKTDVKLTTHLHLVLRLWMCGPVTSLSNIPP